jgi:hypothetical protein
LVPRLEWFSQTWADVADTAGVEFTLLPHRNVAENVLLGRGSTAGGER